MRSNEAILVDQLLNRLRVEPSEQTFNQVKATNIGTTKVHEVSTLTIDSFSAIFIANAEFQVFVAR